MRLLLNLALFAGLKAQIASAASIGLTAFVLAAPADAGVVMTQPKLKKARGRTVAPFSLFIILMERSDARYSAF